MGMINRFNSFFGLGDEDESFYMEEMEQETKVKNTKQKPQLSNRQGSPVAMNVRKDTKKPSNVVSINQSQQQGKIIVVEPRVYSEVKEIADLLLANQAVVLNFNRIEKNEAKKIVDFLMGTIYAIEGDMQRVGNEIFLCTPKNVEIDGVLDQSSNFDDLEIY
ncbi:cell division protein SepF [Desemzia sp. RIT804]|uniref:cell division protein SepF n=1 Tax=Desemzia sp. RIT 804 TaxID=2810209 RepID=UPI00194E4AA5|nr:cell division protein SepF [Desemzia sp. RIT 804]MBM6613509.1 cell division protein SepF [Desemzia sp. RIT 804]